MKNLRNFSDFLNEAKVDRTATIKAETDTQITNKIEKLLREAMKLTEDVEAQRAEFEKAVKIKELELKSKQAAIMQAMQEMDTTTLKFKKILATIDTSKGRITHSYATLWEFALNQATAAQKKALIEYKEVNQKINPDKLTLKLKRLPESVVNEGIADMLSGVWNWLKAKAAQFLGTTKIYTESVDALESVVNAAK
jgi:hypothetical protein